MRKQMSHSTNTKKKSNYIFIEIVNMTFPKRNEKTNNIASTFVYKIRDNFTFNIHSMTSLLTNVFLYIFENLISKGHSQKYKSLLDQSYK